MNGWNLRHQRLTLDLPGSVGLVIVVATLALLAGCSASSGVTVNLRAASAAVRGVR